VIGVLVDTLTRQGVQVARARAEATGLARLLARTLASDTGTLSETTDALRRIFDLDSITLLRATDGGWEIVSAVGAPVPQRPEEAQFTVELADRRLLALTGSRLQDEDAELLQALLSEVRQIRERAELDRLASD
jgi:two-component system sensor histidine kinase KdpD